MLRTQTAPGWKRRPGLHPTLSRIGRIVPTPIGSMSTGRSVASELQLCAYTGALAAPVLLLAYQIAASAPAEPVHALKVISATGAQHSSANGPQGRSSGGGISPRLAQLERKAIFFHASPTP